MFLFTDKQRAIKEVMEWRVDKRKPFVGRFGAEILECFRSFRHDTKRSRNCSHSFRLRSLFSDDVMCTTDRQTDRQTDREIKQFFIIYMNS